MIFIFFVSLQHQMKHFFRNTTIVTLVLFFLTSATGFNVVHFCCNTCAEHGFFEVFQDSSCSDIHSKHQNGDCCEHKSNHQNGISTTSENCSLTRISIDFSTLQKQIKVIPALIVEIFDFDFSTVKKIVETEIVHKNLKAPPLLSGRIILEKKATFII